MILVPLPSRQMAGISHPIPKTSHLRDQHGLVFSVWRKEKEIEKLVKVRDQPQVEHLEYHGTGADSHHKGPDMGRTRWDPPDCRPAPTWGDRMAMLECLAASNGGQCKWREGVLYRGFPRAGVRVVGKKRKRSPGGPYCAACHCRRYLPPNIYGVGPPSGAFPCKQPPQRACRPGAICRG